MADSQVVVRDAVRDNVRDAVRAVEGGIGGINGSNHYSKSFGNVGDWTYDRNSFQYPDTESGYVKGLEALDVTEPWLGGGLRVEPASTNALLYTILLDNVVWVSDGDGAIAEAPTIVGPTGTGPGQVYEVTGSTGGGNYIYQYTAAYTAGKPCTFSAYVKKNTEQYLSVAMYDSITTEGVDLVLNFDDIDSSVQGSQGGLTGDWGYETLADGWYRVWVTAEGGTHARQGCVLGSGAAGACDAYCAYLQAENKTTSTSFIPTTSATATRARATLSANLETDLGMDVNPSAMPGRFTARFKFRVMEDFAGLAWKRFYQLDGSTDTYGSEVVLTTDAGDASKITMYANSGVATVISYTHPQDIVRGEVFDVVFQLTNEPGQTYPRVYLRLWVNGTFAGEQAIGVSVTEWDELDNVILGVPNSSSLYNIAVLEYEHWNYALLEDELLPILERARQDDPYVLRFDNDNTDLGVLSFTRASTAYVTDEDTGAVTEIAVDAPDINSEGLLLEPERTNILPYSENIAEWSSAVGVIGIDVSSTITCPRNAWEIIMTTAGSSTRWFSNTFTVVTATEYAYTAVVKSRPNNVNYFQLVPSGEFGPGNRHVTFDIINGTVEDESADVTGYIEELPDGWYACTCVTTSTGSGTAQVIPAMNEIPTQRLDSMALDLDAGFYFSHAQMEAGAFATSYIKTEAATATRSRGFLEGTIAGAADQWSATGPTVGVTMQCIYKQLMDIDIVHTVLCLQSRTTYNANDLVRVTKLASGEYSGWSTGAGTSASATTSVAELGGYVTKKGDLIDQRVGSSSLTNGGRTLTRILGEDGTVLASDVDIMYGTLPEMASGLDELIVGDLFASGSGGPVYNRKVRIQKVYVRQGSSSSDQLRAISDE